MTAPQRLRRIFVRLAVVGVAAGGVLLFSSGTANADGKCSTVEWHNKPSECAKKLPAEPKSMCKEPPVAEAPDAGMAGWFAQEPEWYHDKKYKNVRVPEGQYTVYGYGGYQLPTYDLGCAGDAVPSKDGAGNSMANLEFTIATGIIGASNGLREAAWEPAGMWGWADKFVSKATHAIYTKVFSPFGAITVGLVGLYLIWRSRQADMSMAVTTAGWAVLVLIVVTAVARWPVESANFADEGLTQSLSVVQDAIGPPADNNCSGSCKDLRSPAMRASDMATGEILYENWIRSELGQNEKVTYKRDSKGDVVKDGNGDPVVKSGNTAYKYGPALYDATAFTWEEIRKARSDSNERHRIVASKEAEWRNVAAAIKKEDPEAYQNLTGQNGWDRAGTGLLAILSALFFALFDITASILIILGFLLIRWAVVALPLIGTIAILRPASGGFKRLISAVVAAIINVVVFGVAAAVYLFAVSQILSAGIPGWLQVTLIALIGAAAWMLLRPYRRIGSLRGGSSIADAALGRRRSTVNVNQKITIKDKTGRRGGCQVQQGTPDGGVQTRRRPLPHQPVGGSAVASGAGPLRQRLAVGLLGLPPQRFRQRLAGR
jgi:hypothetical protein